MVPLEAANDTTLTLCMEANECRVGGRVHIHVASYIHVFMYVSCIDRAEDM